jgi:hypothetical protein
MRMAVAVSVVGMAKMRVAVLVRGFGGIAGRDNRSVSVLVHLQIVLVHLQIFYAFEEAGAAGLQSYYAV